MENVYGKCCDVYEGYSARKKKALALVLVTPSFLQFLRVKMSS